MASATEWLERLGYVYGDLRPANILLDAGEVLKVGDFDAAVRIGGQLRVTAASFGKLGKDYKAPVAGAVSEHYAVGSCIYNIRTGHEPFHVFEGPVMVRKLMNNRLPPILSDYILGDVVQQCWHGGYRSVKGLEHDILIRLRDDCKRQADEIGANIVQDCSKDSDYTEETLVAECEAFMSSENDLLFKK